MTRIWIRKRSLGVAASIVITLLLSAAAVSAAVRQGDSGRAITIRLGGDWDTLDPAKTTNARGYQMIDSLYDRLVYVTPAGAVKPYLATSWKTTPTSAVLNVRTDVTCADGTRLTPVAMARSLTRMGAPATAAPYAYRTVGKAGYTVVGNNTKGTVTIRLKAANSDLLLGLGMPWASIVCPAGLKKLGSLKTKAAGSGPFVLRTAVRGDHYTLALRAGWRWGPQGASDRVLPSAVTYKVVENETTAANLVLSGQLDVAQISGADLPRVQATKGLTRVLSDGIGADGIVLNQSAGLPGADPAVREAVFLAIDAGQFMQAALADQGRALKTLYTANMGCKDPNGSLVPPLDQQKAKSVLAAAGWTAGSDGLVRKNGQTLKIRITGYTGQGQGPEYLLQALRGVGIDASANVVDFNTYVDTIFNKGDWDLQNYPFGSVMPSPAIFIGQVAGEGPPKGANVANIQNSAYIAAAKAAQGASAATRCAAWNKAEAALFTGFDVKPTGVSVGSYFGRKVTFKVFGGIVVDPTSLRAG